MHALSSDQAQLAIYAAQRSTDTALTLIMINKTGNPLATSLRIDHFTAPAAATVYRYSSANLDAIERQPDLPVVANPLTLTVPANSITLIKMVPAGSADPTPSPSATPIPSPTPGMPGTERTWLPSIRR